MRNLKKILALVLALVMSLSLMAVASADDELNLGDVSDVYAESVDVLTGLKVFMGNKGEFLPKDNITRAEVAAIIYRIVTGDVTNSQNGIYADYNKFSDVTSDAWYAGYVNYCANAEYVKGVGYDANGKAMFKPQQNVTGYEALAMILRAIGYDRNNEFTGPSWQIQTAATARNRGILVNIQEGTLGTAATREAVAEILCKTILVPVADYSLAFGYRTTDANGKDNETLAYKTFKMEKIDGVVLANEYAALDADTPLPAGQTKLELADDTTKTMDVASDLDAIGESRYVYVVPKAGTTRFDLVCSKLYGEENNNVYDNEGAEVKTVGNSTGTAAGITSIEGAEHFINFSQNDEYETKIRIKYVMQVRMSQYDAMLMYYQNGTKDNSMLQDLTDNTEIKGTYNDTKAPNQVNGKDYWYISFPSSINSNWNQLITSNATHTYEYTKVIPAFTKLTDTDWANLQSIFANADYVSSPIVGEVYVGTNSTSTFDLLPILTGTGLTGTRDVSDYITWEKFVADYLNVKENKTQVTSNGLGQHLKIVDNNQDGVAEYVLQTKYTVAVMAANGTSLDVSGVQLVDSSIRDNINSIPSATTPFFSTEGLAAGDVVVYALIDGKIHATKAEGETVKINTVNRAGKTATATGEDGKTWTESDVHTHSQANGLTSGVTGMVGNTTYNLYFDLYGNLAAYTEGTNGGLVLITNGWYNSTISGPEYAIQAWVDGSLQTVNVTTNGSLFVSNEGSGNTWGKLKTTFGGGSINNTGVKTDGRDHVQTIVANLDGNILTPVDKTYLYSQNLRMLDMRNNVIPGRDNANTSWAVSYATEYGVNKTAYNAPGNVNGSTTDAGARTFEGDRASYYEVRALSNTVYYTVYKGIGSDSMTSASNVVVRSYTGYNNVPAIDSTYIEDVYAVGAKAQAAGGATYYTAQVVVIELNTNYTGSRRDSEQVFIPEFTQVTNNIGIEDVTMIRGNGEVSTVQVDMTRSVTSDQYDTAGGTGRNGRRPGLYYMDPSDTNPDVYVIQCMSPAQIRANNYAVGYSRESYGTLGNNYAQVELLARPETAPAGNTYDIAYFGSNATLDKWNQAVATRPVASGEYNWSSRSVVTENTYTYGGTAATLVKAAPAVVLNQGANGDAGTNVNGLNERWTDYTAVVTEAEFPDRIASFNTLNRNEVLVRYDDNGDVIYAISFNETNAAQIVWWNCLPALNYSVTDSILFWGNGGVDDGTKALIIPYSAADSTKPIIDLSALGASVMSHALYKEEPLGSGHWNLLNANQEGDQRPDRDSTQSYRLEVKLNSGEVLIYRLTQSAATNDAQLIIKSTGADAPASFDLTNEAHTNVLTFIGRYKANNNGTVKWTVTTPDGTFTAETDINGNVIDNNIPSTLDVGDTTSITAQVVNEDNTNANTYNDTRTDALAAAKTAAKAALDEFVQGWISGNELTKAEIEANAAYKAIVEMIDAATTEARAKEVFGKYTNTGTDNNPHHTGEAYDGLHSNWNTGDEATYADAFTVNGQLYTCAKEGLLNSLDADSAVKSASAADEQIKPVSGLNGTGTNRPTYAAANKNLGVTSITSSKDDETGIETRTIHIDAATLTAFLAEATGAETESSDVALLKQNINGTDYLFVGVGWSGPTNAVKYAFMNNGNWVSSDASAVTKATDGNFYRYVAIALKSGDDWVPRTPPITNSEFTFRFVDGEGNVLGSPQKSLISVVIDGE